jgi:RNA polymerase sigma-70 factor (ECF subfamily)
VADDGREVLLEAARRGDGEALDTLLQDVQPQIYRFSLKMCGQREDAQEVLQETLLAAARTVRGFRGASSVSTWLYAIARSFCIKKRRRSVFAPEIVSLDAQPEAARAVSAAGPDPERELAQHELSDALDSAIGSLDAGPREVLVLRDVEGLSADEVAAVTGLSVAAVKSRLHRARAAVRERLLPRLAAPPPVLPGRPPVAACPDVVNLLSRHLEGEIGADTCAAMERHVAACERCRGACDSLRETLRLCQAHPAPPVPAALRDSIRRGIRALLTGQDAGTSRAAGKSQG